MNKVYCLLCLSLSHFTLQRSSVQFLSSLLLCLCLLSREDILSPQIVLIEKLYTDNNGEQVNGSLVKKHCYLCYYINLVFFSLCLKLWK